MADSEGCIIEVSLYIIFKYFLKRLHINSINFNYTIIQHNYIKNIIKNNGKEAHI